MKAIMRMFLKVHVGLYRLTKGRFGGRMNGGDVLLLTTTGAKTGAKRVVPLMYQQQGDSYLVVASAAGDDRHPGWFHNLSANPSVTVEVGGRALAATAAPLAEPARQEAYDRFASAMNNFGTYAERTDRVIPVVELTPTV